MPRPKDGYRNARGEPVPGTHDPISRFMDQKALKFWAWNQGKKGVSLYERTALDIGTCVHTMIELDIGKQAIDDIRFYAANTLKDPADLEKATAAFKAWIEWRSVHSVTPVAQEIPLVSERYQYGGTPDLIAMVDDRLCLLDFKTSKDGSVYPDKLLALAAHGRLWTEHNPGQLLTGGYRLIMLPKDGSKPKPHTYLDLEPQWELFKLYLQAYRLDKSCSDKKVLAGVSMREAEPLPETASPPIAPTVKATKPRIRVKSSSTPSMTMAEMLRQYGHVPNVAAEARA